MLISWYNIKQQKIKCRVECLLFKFSLFSLLIFPFTKTQIDRNYSDPKFLVTERLRTASYLYRWFFYTISFKFFWRPFYSVNHSFSILILSPLLLQPILKIVNICLGTSLLTFISLGMFPSVHSPCYFVLFRFQFFTEQTFWNFDVIFPASDVASSILLLL